MGEVAAAEAEAEEAARRPRFTFRQGLLVALAGSAAIAFVLTEVAVFRVTGAPLWVVLLAAVAYAMALLVWAGLWKRPIHVAGVIAAALAGFFAGYMVAIFVANLVSRGPDT